MEGGTVRDQPSPQPNALFDGVYASTLPMLVAPRLRREATLKNLEIYGGRDPRSVPVYGFAEAARYVRIAGATLRSWVVGRPYPLRDGEGFFEPLIALKYGELVNLSKSGQMAMKLVLDAYLKRVEWDGEDLSIRLYPFLRSDLGYRYQELGSSHSRQAHPAFLEHHERPFIARLYRPPSDGVEKGIPGRVEMWISGAEWRRHRP